MDKSDVWSGYTQIWQAALSAILPSRVLEFALHRTKRPILNIPRDATIEQLRLLWRRIGAAWVERPYFHVDFGESEFHEAPGLIFIIAKLWERKKIGLKTTVQLPKHPEVLNFLRDLRFTNAIEKALSVSTEEILTSESNHRLRQISQPSRILPWALGPTLPFNLFPIEALFVRDLGHLAAANFASRWLASDVVSALDQDLGGKGKQVATHVVLEALMYAVEREDTRLVLTAAHYGVLQANGRPQLTIMFWDDGKSIAQHQRRELPVDGPVHLAGLSLSRTYAVELLSGKRPPSRRDISSRELVELDENSPLQVLQTISPMVAEDTPTSSLGGLEVLANSVLDVFSGELEVVTGNVRLTISSDHRVHTPGRVTPVRAQIEVDPRGAPEFCGNLLTLRIPLSR